jgi:histidine triad (HIT) family protein
MAEMTTFIQEVVALVGIKESGYRLISNVGHNGGQEVNHLHWHVVGGAKLTFPHLVDANPQDFF